MDEVMDAPLELEADPIETGEDTSGETPPESTETPTEQTQTQEEPNANQAAVIDGKKLSDAAKATLEEIKAKDPRLAGQLRTALFESDALRRAFPGGIREAREIAQFVSEVGGREGYQASQAELSAWQAFDQKFIAGDPAIVASMVENNPGSFVKLAPEVFSKYAELHPEGWTNYVSQIFLSDIMGANMPLHMERLKDLIGDNPAALEKWKVIGDYFNRISGLAKAPVTPPKFADATPAPGNDLAEREANLTRTEWVTAANADRSSVYNSEFTRLLAGRKITPDQKAAINELYASRLSAKIKAIPKHEDKVNRFFSAKDKNGYVNHMRSVYRSEIPKALASAINAILPSKPGPKPVQGTGVKPSVAAPGGIKKAPDPGFVRVGGPPARGTVKYGPGGTTPQMIQQGKAILNDGKRITWR